MASIKTEDIILGFTCRECEWECTADPSSLVEAGTPLCTNCDTEMELDTTHDVFIGAARYLVTVSDCTTAQADQVIAERINHDEDYGFDYTISYEGD